MAEERLTRRKHAGGAAFALRTVLADCGVQIQDVSRFYVSTCGERVPNPGAPVPLSENDFLTLSAIGVSAEKICWMPSHHLSHAYAAFEPSSFRRALVLVMDDAGSAPAKGSYFTGRGEARADISGELERTNCFLADRSNGYELVAQILAKPPFAGGPATMYRYVTDFLSLNGMTECGKTMALAAYGHLGALSKLRLLMRSEIGHVTCLAKQPAESIGAVRELLGAAGYGYMRLWNPNKGLQDAHTDLARHAQEELEEAVMTTIRYLIGTYGVSELCMSGGAALNCVLIGKVLTMPEVTSAYIAAAPGDTGQPLGSCLYGVRQASIALPRELLGPYLGPRYPLYRVQRACEAWGSGLQISRGNIAHRVAEAIATGKVVAVYHGRSEVGPRALGHRSILADPRDTRMRDYLNRVVKGRELYRPYGAAILVEETERLIGWPVASPFMMVALPLSTDWQQRIPAVCHVDGTSRIQTVSQYDSRWFHDILKSFYALTGIPAVLNTSFNAAGKPIVETPEDALVAFINMHIDALAIEEWYLEKPVCLTKAG